MSEVEFPKELAYITNEGLANLRSQLAAAQERVEKLAAILVEYAKEKDAESAKAAKYWEAAQAVIDDMQDAPASWYIPDEAKAKVRELAKALESDAGEGAME